MGLLDIFKGASTAGVTAITDTVVNVGKGVADIVDQFVTNPEEKQAALQALREYEIDLQKQALEADKIQLADRQGARQMASVHGRLQTSFALSFLIFFFALLIGEFIFLGYIIGWALNGETVLPEWLQVLISTTMSGTIGYMASMLKEVVGFLFGGSAGGDQAGQALAENFRNLESRSTTGEVQ